MVSDLTELEIRKSLFEVSSAKKDECLKFVMSTLRIIQTFPSLASLVGVLTFPSKSQSSKLDTPPIALPQFSEYFPN
jgi:hypothetical protein